MSRLNAILLKGRIVPIAAILVVAYLIVILVPRRTNTVVTVDQVHQWSEENAPPHRSIVWQPAQPVDPIVIDQADHSLIRPQLDEGGSVLYFTRRGDNGKKDIYSARRDGERWRDAAPVAGLNTEYDEIGPVIQKGGEKLYLYSNRPGGYGGFDIYESHRTTDGWSKPRNVGSAVNSPAHEYDPCVSSEGKRLFFSSNRSPQMQRLLLEGKLNNRSAAWRSTLRADLGLNKFDLYESRRANSGESWNPARTIPQINRENSNEGAPVVDGGGAFLYFVSDRVQRPNEESNFDIYRVRLRAEQFGNPENLGVGVNSPANEIEPALSEEGFRIYFSRNAISTQDGVDPSRYSLFASMAVEVEETVEWDDSNLRATSSFVTDWMSNNWWWLGFVLLLLSLLAALWWFFKRVSFRRATVPTFLLVAIVVHLLLAAGTFYVTFVHRELVDRLPDGVKDIFVATALESEDSSKTEDPIEQLSDFESVETAEVENVKRQALSEPNVFAPKNDSQPVVPIQPLRHSASTPKIVATVPIKSTAPNSSRLPRRTVQQVIAESAIDIERPQSDSTKMSTLKIAAANVNTEKEDTEIKVVGPEPRTTQVQSVVRLENETPGHAATSPGRSIASELKPISRARVVNHELKLGEAQPIEGIQIVQTLKPVSADPSRHIQNGISVSKAEQLSEKAPIVSRDTDSAIRESSVRNENSPTAELPISRRIVRPRANVARSSRRSLLASSDSRDNEPRIEPIELNRSDKPSDARTANLVPQPTIRVRPTNEARGQLEAPSNSGRQSINSVTARLQPDRLTRAFDLRPSASATKSRGLNRRRSRSARIEIAEDNIGIQSLLRLRQTDGKAKKDLIKAFGGADQTHASIRLGLEWLRRHQFEDGHWSFNNFETCCKNHKHGKCGGRGSANSDTGATGFALLPFLGDGHTHLAGDYKDAVDRGLEWLIARQKKDGDLCAGNEGNARMYSHGIATIALCEAFALTDDPKLREPAQKAINFIAQAQHKSGGWRYQPRQGGDTSVVGWQVMALKSGQMAGLQVPNPTLDGARRWLRHVGGQGKKLGRFGYTHHDFKVAMSAEALLCLQYLNAERSDPQLVAGAEYLLKHLPKHGKESSYYWYYGTQFMFHMQGDYWRRWNTSLQGLILKTQNKNKNRSGSWDPKDQWERTGGRVYSTSMRLLMLEVYYRHLPLYQVLNE